MYGYKSGNEPKNDNIFKSINNVIRGWGSSVFGKAKSDDWWIFDYPVNLSIATFPGPTQYGHVGVIESGYGWTYVQGGAAPRLSDSGIDKAKMSHSNWPEGTKPRTSIIKPMINADGTVNWKKISIDGGSKYYDVSAYVAIGPG